MPQRPSYWGESEAWEWRRRLKEEREAVAREAEECQLWHAEEGRRMAYFPDHGVPLNEKRSCFGERMETRRPFHYEGMKEMNLGTQVMTPFCPNHGRLNH